MKIKSGFIIREVAGKNVAVATGELSRSFNGMITLNDTAKFIFESFQQETTVEEVVQAVLAKFDIDEATAKKDVQTLVDQLKGANLFS